MRRPSISMWSNRGSPSTRGRPRARMAGLHRPAGAFLTPGGLDPVGRASLVRGSDEVRDGASDDLRLVPPGHVTGTLDHLELGVREAIDERAVGFDRSRRI